MLDSDIKPSLVCAFCSKRSLLLRSDTEFGLMIALCQVHTSSCDVRTKKEGLRRTQLLLRLLRIWQFCIHYTTIVNQNCFQMRWFRQLPRADSGEARADGWDGRDLPVWNHQSRSPKVSLCLFWFPHIALPGAQIFWRRACTSEIQQRHLLCASPRKQGFFGICRLQFAGLRRFNSFKLFWKSLL